MEIITNEIKEILAILEGRKKMYLHQQKNNSPFNDEEYMAYMILDYITNLQNEIFDLKDTIQNKNDCIGAYESIIEDRDKRIDKAVEYIEKDTRWFDSKYASVYGELCDCEGYNSNRLEVMVNPSNLLDILRGDE